MNERQRSGSGEYVIKVRSHLDDKKRYWFEGMTMTTGYDEEGRPITTFTGPLADQAALHGVLAKIRDMNLPLISVSRVSSDTADDPLASRDVD
jgi:hypothetical protein